MLFCFQSIAKECTLLDTPSSECTSLVVDGPTNLEKFKNFETITALRITANPLPSFKNWVSIVTVQIESEITTIPENTFENMFSLTSINIPASVETIESGAFQWCKSLKSLTIPQSTTSIAPNIVLNCFSFEGFEVTEGNSKYTSVGGILMDNAQLSIISFPQGLKKDIILPASLQAINDNSLTDCKFTKLTFQGSKIGEKAIYECPYLEEFFSNSVTEIGAYSLSRCKSLKSVTIPKLTVIGSDSFSFTRLTSVSLGKLNSLGSGAFSYCRELSSVSIQGTPFIPSKAFYFCTGLTSLTIPEDTTRIESDAFSHCYRLSDLSLGKNLAEIQDGAFKYAYKLKSVHFPIKMTKISGFIDSGVESITYDEGIKVTEIDLTGMKELRSFVFPPSYTDVSSDDFYDNTVNLKHFSGLNFTADNPAFTSVDGVVYSKDKTVLIHYPLGLGKEEFTLPSDVVTIAKGAFKGVNTLHSLIIPDKCKLKTVQKEAFKNLYNVKTLTLPSSVTVIDESVFEGSGMHIIELKGKITSIKARAFAKSHINKFILPKTVSFLEKSAFESSHILTFTFEPGTQVTQIPACCFMNTPIAKIDIPDTIECIGDYAFSGTSLYEFKLPSQCTKLGEYVFQNTLLSEAFSFGGKYNAGIFCGCSNIESIVINDQITEIGAFSFFGCSSLSKVDFTGCIISVIPASAFSGTGLKSIILPESVSIIEQSAFSNCQSLAKFEMTNFLTKIGDNAFAGCKSLKSMKIMAGLTSGIYSILHDDLEQIEASSESKYTVIGNCVGKGNALIGIPSNAKTVTIPKDFTALAEDLNGNLEIDAEEITFETNFGNEEIAVTCERATKVVVNVDAPKMTFSSLEMKSILLNKVKTLAPDALSGCPNLEEVHAPLLETVGENAFGDLPIKAFTVPKSLTIPAGMFDTCLALESIALENDHPLYTVENYAIVTKSEPREIVAFPKGLKTDFAIKDDAVIANGNAFTNSLVTALTLGQIKGTIGNMQNLKSVTLKGSYDIDMNAFSNCPNLESITGDNVVNGVLVHNNKIIRLPCKYQITSLDVNVNQSIEGDALQSSSTLKSIKFEAGNEEQAETLMLSNLPNLKQILNIPKTVKTLMFTNLPLLEEITIAADNSYLFTYQQMIFEGEDISHLVFIPSGGDTIYIPNFVTQAEAFKVPVEKDVYFEEFSMLREMRAPVGARSVAFSDRIESILRPEGDAYQNIQTISFDQDSVITEIDWLNNIKSVEAIYFPPNLASFENGVGLESLKTIVFGEIATIGTYAFDSAKITSAKLPWTVCKIDNTAFRSNGFEGFEMDSESVLQTVPMFVGTKNLKLHITKYCTSLEVPNLQFNFANIVQLTVDPANEIIKFENNLLYSLNPFFVAWATPNAAVTLPAHTQVILDYAFAFHTGPIDLNMTRDSCLSSVQEYAFRDSSLTEFSIVPRLSYAAQNAFTGCNLSTLKIYDTENAVIAYFYFIDTITTIYVDDPSTFDKTPFANSANIKVLPFDQKDDADGNNSTGWIIGLSITAAVIILGVAIAAIIIIKRRRNIEDLVSSVSSQELLMTGDKI